MPRINDYVTVQDLTPPGKRADTLVIDGDQVIHLRLALPHLEDEVAFVPIQGSDGDLAFAKLFEDPAYV